MELPPGGDCKIDISRNGFDREEMTQMVPDIGAFFLYGRLTYIDCFGQRYYGTFRYEHIGKIEGDGPVHMKASLGGNSFGHAH